MSIYIHTECFFFSLLRSYITTSIFGIHILSLSSVDVISTLEVSYLSGALYNRHESLCLTKIVRGDIYFDRENVI